MKFIRYGNLKAYRQQQYVASPEAGQWPCLPPRPKGFFAFPYGYKDGFYLKKHPASDPNSNMQYLRDKTGRKLTEADKMVYSETETEYSPYLDQDIPAIVETMSDSKFLKKFGLPKMPILTERRPQWICYMKDPRHPPKLAADGNLDQEVNYLKDKDGELVPANELMDRTWTLDDFCEDWFEHCKEEDFKDDYLDRFGIEYDPYSTPDTPVMRDGKMEYERTGVRMLFDKLERELGIGMKHIYVWPVYKRCENVYLVTFKKPHVFEYNGCVWHHLREYVPAGSILAAYGTTWVYTSTRDLERALKHAEPAIWHVNRLAGRTTSRFGGPWTMNTGLDPNGMYECFFDEEDARKTT